MKKFLISKIFFNFLCDTCLGKNSKIFFGHPHLKNFNCTNQIESDDHVSKIFRNLKNNYCIELKKYIDIFLFHSNIERTRLFLKE